MLNLGSAELLVILLVALLVLGPTKLPEAARQVGRAMAELRRLSSGFQNELRNAMDQPTVERSPTPLATPAPVEPSDHEAMNATIAAARDDAIATADASGQQEPREAGLAPSRRTKKTAAGKKAAVKKAAPAEKQSAPAKKVATAKKKAPAKKVPAAKKEAPATKAAASKKRGE